MIKDILIVGAFHEMIELCESAGMRIAGIFDNSITGEYMGYPIIGDDTFAQSADTFKKNPVVITPDLPKIRKKLYEYYHNCGFTFTSVISPDSRISKSTSIGNGTVIQAGVNISASAKIGNFVKINSLANIMHDTVIGDFTTVAPNAVLLGKVRVDENCYIGANSTILPNKTIGQGSTVGAGAVVTKDCSSGITVIGSPARELRK